jgi:hypothetical protein
MMEAERTSETSTRVHGATTQKTAILGYEKSLSEYGHAEVIPNILSKLETSLLEVHSTLKKEQEPNLTCTDTHSHASFPNEMKEGVTEPKKHVTQLYFILIMQSRWQCIEPRLQQWLPSKSCWIHVNHATARHL